MAPDADPELVARARRVGREVFHRERVALCMQGKTPKAARRIAGRRGREAADAFLRTARDADMRDV